MSALGEMENGATPDQFLLAGGSSGTTPNSNGVCAISKMIWFPGKSMLIAKLAAGASKLVELEMQLAVVLGTARAKELAGSLRFACCLLLCKGLVRRQGRPGPSGSASSTRIDVLRILAGSLAEVHVSSPREIACGAPRPTGIAKVCTSSGWP